MLMGCTADVEITPTVPTPDGAIAINIDGSINQTYTTRVDDGGFCDGDQIGLYGVNYTNNNSAPGTLADEGNQVDNARYTFDEENWKWESSGSVYYKDAETNIDLYAYYPYGSVNSVSEYAFEVQQDQSGGNAVDGYALSDFLWGKAENIAPSENKVKIKFNHKMACANVILKEGDGFESGEFEQLKKGVLVMNTTRTSTIDLSTGKVTAVGEAPMEGIVMKSNADGFRAIVVPQNVEAGKSLFSITVDGIGYRFKKDVDFTYEQGKQSKFTIKINKKKHSGEYEFILTDTEIVDWVADLDTHGGEARQYYVVHCEEPGTLKEKILADKKDPAKIKNLKVSGIIAGKDMNFGEFPNLRALNLKEAEIVSVYSVLVCLTINGSEIWSEEYFDYEAPAIEYKDAILARYPEATSVQFPYGEDSMPEKTEAHHLSGWVPNSLVTFVFPEKVTKLSMSFAYSNLSGAVIIPDGVTELGRATFQNCVNITSVDLPEGLKNIGWEGDGSWYSPDQGVFAGCINLAGPLNLPSTVTHIGWGAFRDCSNLGGPLILPENLEFLGEQAFFNCSSFSGDLKIPTSLKNMGSDAFAKCSGLNGSLILHDNFELANSHDIYGKFGYCGFQGELILPANIKEIPTRCFQNCDFSTIVNFPENLQVIREYAFYGCHRLMGVLEFPASLVTIEPFAFCGCDHIEGIVLPEDLGAISSHAFSDCYGLLSIKCKANEPPVLSAGVFDGVDKATAVVEVPERSVNPYQSDTRWGEFKRITANHNFFIACKHMRVLNAKHSREIDLHAPTNYTWSVESLPDWVTVTPSSGVGRTKVVITVNEMTVADVGSFEINTGVYNRPNYETHAGRAGEIVFLLNDKDARITLKVEQYDYEYGDGDVIVNQTATQGDGVNIVFMGDCFDARDIAHGSYLDGINEAIGYYFDIEPYKTYRDYFNVYTVFGMSNDSGMGTLNTVRDAKFGSQYSLEGITPDTQTTYEYAMLAETVDESNLNKTLVVMVENTEDYGGICYMWGDGSAIAVCPMSADAYPFDFRGIVQHEAGGHGFAKLADEYIYHNAFIETCPCACCNHLDAFRAGKALGWYRNLSESGDMRTVEWAHLIFHPDYSNIVDMYEGGYFHTRGIYRSEATSCMNNNIPYYSAISRQEMVERIMRYGGLEFDINDFYARDVRDASNNTSASTFAVESSIVVNSGAGKQMPPRYMGDKPQLKKSNK